MIASANAIKLAGGTPILVDIAADNFCIDLRAAERAVTRRTRAMMVVSINGRSPDMSSAAELCRRHGLILVEDAAQSLGSRHQSRHLGTFGDLGCFSFSTPKVITTGQGGAVVTNNPDLAARMRLIKDFGRTRPGVDQHGVLGYNFKFTDVQAVIGLEQMKKLDWRVRRKKAIYERYSSQLDAARGIRLAPTDLAQTSPWFIDVLSDCRDELAAFLRENGIGTRPFYPAIHTQPPYGSVEGSFPVSVMISATGLWLPSSSFLTDEDIDYICDRIRSFRCGVASGTQTDGGAGTR
jgi:perosamine synthetase